MSMIERLLRQNAEADKRLQDIEMQDVVPVVARYSRSTAQAIAHNTSTVVNYDTQVFDPYAAVTTGASWVFTAPVAGYYQVEAKVTFVATATWTPGETCQILVFINGVTEGILDYRSDLPAAAGVAVSVGGGLIVHMAKGDTLDIQVLQASGASLNLVASAVHNHVAIGRIKG